VVLQTRLRDAGEMPDAAGLGVSFLNTRTWGESLQSCRDHPEVLDDDVDRALAELKRRFDREGDAASHLATVRSTRIILRERHTARPAGASVRLARDLGRVRFTTGADS